MLIMISFIGMVILNRIVWMNYY